MAKKQADSSLDKQLETLKKIVEKMEEKDLPLEEALSQFEHGISLIRECQKTLSEAEQKIEILLRQNHEEKLTSFDNHE